MESEYPPGKHLLLDFWGCDRLTDIQLVEKAMEDAAKACGATILETKLHSFGEDGGVTGVAILAESHISIHTWPETAYVALDVFMCGNCNPNKSIAVFEKYFSPQERKISEHERGRQNS